MVLRCRPSPPMTDHGIGDGRLVENRLDFRHIEVIAVAPDRVNLLGANIDDKGAGKTRCPRRSSRQGDLIRDVRRHPAVPSPSLRAVNRQSPEDLVLDFIHGIDRSRGKTPRRRDALHRSPADRALVWRRDGCHTRQRLHHRERGAPGPGFSLASNTEVLTPGFTVRIWSGSGQFITMGEMQALASGFRPTSCRPPPTAWSSRPGGANRQGVAVLGERRQGALDQRGLAGRSIAAASPYCAQLGRPGTEARPARGLGIRVRPVCGAALSPLCGATHEGGVVQWSGVIAALMTLLSWPFWSFSPVDLAEELDAIEIGKPADAARVLCSRTAVAGMNAARG